MFPMINLIFWLVQAQPTFEYSGKLAAETNKVRGEMQVSILING